VVVVLGGGDARAVVCGGAAANFLSNEINNKSPMRVTLFVRRESDLSSFRTMIR
jgi:hypothetical protein